MFHGCCWETCETFSLIAKTYFVAPLSTSIEVWALRFVQTCSVGSEICRVSWKLSCHTKGPRLGPKWQVAVGHCFFVFVITRERPKSDQGITMSFAFQKGWTACSSSQAEVAPADIVDITIRRRPNCQSRYEDFHYKDRSFAGLW